MDAKKIALANGGFALVDSDDYESLSKFKWYCSRWGYAHRQGWEKKPTGEREHWTIWMHRVINETPHGLYTDHINGKKLDNRKCNLRTVDKSRNSTNRPKMARRAGSTSEFKGVRFNKIAHVWEARIQNHGRARTTYHRTEEQAALDYNRMAAEMFGDCASLNAIPEGTEPTVRRKKTSQYRGVTFHKRTHKWRASIMVGQFNSEREAALAYNDASLKLRGDKAILNSVD